MYDLDSYRKGTLTASSGNGSVIGVGYDGNTGDYNHNRMRGISTVAVDIRGSFTATVVFEATVDGTNWVSISGTPSGGGAAVTGATAAGLWFFSVAGFRNFRVRCTAFTSAPTVGVGTYVADLSGVNSASITIGPTQGAVTTTTPSVADSTSVTGLAANATRKYLLVQNDTAANIMVSLSGATLTGIVPSATNIGIVIPAGGSYENPAHYCPTGAITVYQTSGGTVRTIVFGEA